MRTRSVSQGRRDFLRRSGAVPSTLLLLALGKANYGRADEVSATPACTDAQEPTRQQTAGPFFLPRSPQRGSLLEPGINGTKIVLTGRGWSTRCRAVSGALLPFHRAVGRSSDDRPRARRPDVPGGAASSVRTDGCSGVDSR